MSRKYPPLHLRALIASRIASRAGRHADAVAYLILSIQTEP